ncbi:MAG TPA: GNAT family N-acyltransferase [Xanthomonadaceae bacterium]|nr:GNAT family N-acyltransferase [Xanthomonadaceae bacterium]
MTEDRAVISVERSFYEKFPRLADGRARVFTQPVVDLLRRMACEERINQTLSSLAPREGLDFVEHALKLFDFSYAVANTDRENIPAEGRVVIVANHPLGALDALALLHLVGSVRRDVRIFANDVLLQLAPMKPLLLPVDVVGGRAGVGSVREAFRALEREEALIVFPAGEVSRIRPGGVRDRRWASSFVRFVRRTGAPVLPVHLGGYNSPTFYGLSMLAKPLAALLLAREMFAHQKSRIQISIGEPVPAHALAGASGDEARLAALMRRHVYRLPKRRPPVFPTSTTVAHPEPPGAVRAALEKAQVLGRTSDGKRILMLDPSPDCPALREIGRLRELTFRKVGEGTGLKRDLDRFDYHYRHIVLWDDKALAIVGAYRLGEGRSILDSMGFQGLYSATLFDFAPEARELLVQGVELGRSFVHPDYWGSRSLDYLWQGIGAYLRAHPEVRFLFGPVSLSASLPLPAREWAVHCHRHYFGDERGLAPARNPFLISAEVDTEARATWADCPVAEGLKRLKAKLVEFGAALPTLYRQYVDLCDPQGIAFLGFGVDPDFGHCVDGLILVDLQWLKPAKRTRYIGPSEPGAAKLQNCH